MPWLDDPSRSVTTSAVSWRASACRNPGRVQKVRCATVQSRLQQMTAQATSTKAKNRPESRSHRTCSRLKQLSH